MSELNPRDLSTPEADALLRLRERGRPVPEADIPPDILQPLEKRKLVLCLGGYVRISQDGVKALTERERMLAQPEPTPAARAPRPPSQPGLPTRTLRGLNPAQSAALWRIYIKGPVPIAELDARALNRLARRQLVERRGDRVIVTQQGRELCRSPLVVNDGSPGEMPNPSADLSPIQEQTLAEIPQTGSGPVHQFDGRALRGLVRRGLVEIEEGWVTLTALGKRRRRGRKQLGPRGEEKARSARRSPREDPEELGEAEEGVFSSQPHSPAEAIKRAVAMLEQGVPGERMVTVGDVVVPWKELLAALQDFGSRP